MTSKPPKKSKKKQHTHHTSTIFDHTHLIFGHHQAIIASLALLPCVQKLSVSTSSLPSRRLEPSKEEKGGAYKGDFCETGGEGHRMDLLLIGLGGGALPMFVNKCIPNVSCCFVLCVIMCHVVYIGLFCASYFIYLHMNTLHY